MAVIKKDGFIIGMMELTTKEIKAIEKEGFTVIVK